MMTTGVAYAALAGRVAAKLRIWLTGLRPNLAGGLSLARVRGRLTRVRGKLGRLRAHWLGQSAGLLAAAAQPLVSLAQRLGRRPASRKVDPSGTEVKNVPAEKIPAGGCAARTSA